MKSLLLSSFLFAVLYTLTLITWFTVSELRKPKRKEYQAPPGFELHNKL
jgi:hypothetical protein